MLRRVEPRVVSEQVEAMGTVETKAAGISASCRRSKSFLQRAKPVAAKRRASVPVVLRDRNRTMSRSCAAARPCSSPMTAW